MPFAKCPVCGKHTYLNVTDARGWYAEHFPSSEPGANVPWLCPDCEQRRRADPAMSASSSGTAWDEDVLVASSAQPSEAGTGAANDSRSAEFTIEELTALRAIVEGVAASTGEAFLQSLVRHLAAALDVQYVFVAELAGARTRVRTLAYWAGDHFVENVEFDVAGSPCEEVLQGSLCHHPYGVSLDFPHDRSLRPLGIESYLGVPLVDGDGSVLGHLAVFDDRPMPASPRRLFIFRVFAARAAAELVRERAEEFARASELERARLEQRILELEREIEIGRNDERRG